MPRRRRPPRAGALSELPPLKIASQIATLQLLYYAAALVLFIFTALVSGAPFGANMVLGWDRVRGDTTTGWVMGFVWLLNGGLCMPIAMTLLIARSKLVPDFALTIHGLHFLVVSLYTRTLPRNLMWYLVMAASSAISVALGMWGCRYRELQPVFFGGGRILGRRTPQASMSNAAAMMTGRGDAEDDEDVEMGHKRHESGAQEGYEMRKMENPR